MQNHNESFSWCRVTRGVTALIIRAWNSFWNLCLHINHRKSGHRAGFQWVTRYYNIIIIIILMEVLLWGEQKGSTGSETKLELRGIDNISQPVYWYLCYKQSQLELSQNCPPNINVSLYNAVLQVVTATINSRFQAFPGNSELHKRINWALPQEPSHIC